MTPKRTRRSAVALIALTLAGLGTTLAPTGAATATAATPIAAANGTAEPAGTLRVAQANLQFAMSDARFATDLRRVVASGPDVVSLNEVSRRTDARLRPAGYESFLPREKGNGNAVLWRTDRWTRVDGGYRVLVETGPLKYDKNRLATWATLRSTTGRVVSMVSTHQMQNPAKFGPDKPLRQRLYLQGMERLASLVTDLSTQGPVFVAGDFNSQFRSNDPWGPRRTLAPAGLTSPMESLGITATHDGGGVIDYVFAPRAAATPTTQEVTNLASDHKLLVNDFRLGATTSRTK